jgi:hypothetical protein
MADQNMTQNVASIIEQIVGSGLVLNGQIGINGLTVTSVDKAKELGIVKQQSQQSGQSSQGGQSNQQQEEQKESSGKQNKQQSNDQQQQLSREDYESLREEIGYLRKLLESTQQNQSESKGRSGQGK